MRVLPSFHHGISHQENTAHTIEPLAS
jgi:hypothetical protein